MYFPLSEQDWRTIKLSIQNYKSTVRPVAPDGGKICALAN